MKFEKGQPVEVIDAGLAMIRQLMATTGNPVINHHGWVHSIEPDDTIMVLFPIGDDDPTKHSQLAPYPATDVIARTDAEWLTI